MVQLRGEVESIIYENSENGYTVFSLDTETQEVTCVGILPQLHKGEYLELTGTWTTHALYGKQFQVTSFTKAMPTTCAGIEKYLSSGVIKGIGKRTAKRIVEKFGEATFYVIEEKPELLVELRGITYEKAKRISEIFHEQYELRRAMIFLQEFDISPTYAMNIYKRYKERTFDIVKKNPYRLADDIWGIGFRMADKMAASAGIAQNDIHRIKAGIKYVLTHATNQGHCFLPKQELLQQTSQLLGLHTSLIGHGILELQVENEIWQEHICDTDVVYLNSYYYAEVAVAKKLLTLSESYVPENEACLLEQLVELEQQTGICLAEEQRQAVLASMSHGVLIVTGGPGTGKTTTINTILQLLQSEDCEVVLAAPTGRAAKRMTEATGVEAKTIHRLLGSTFSGEEGKKQLFEHNEDNPIEADVIIVDEVSMVDLMLMYALLRATAVGTRMIFVGDVDQLPSVGAGNVLKDMIHSNCLAVVRLAHIFRQAQESAIIMNAHRINAGEYPVTNEKNSDFFFMRRSFGEEAVSTIQELVTTRLPKFLSCDGLQDIQILTPMRKGILGVQNLNIVLQQTLNPPAQNKAEKDHHKTIFREGDKVMQMKNNYHIAWYMYNEYGKRIDEGTGIYNGDAGKIISIDEQKEKMEVLFDDGKQVCYEFSQLDELELAYAITIHKSQGSEYPAVIIPVQSGPPMLMTRNLLYTAVTRAKQLVVLIGTSEMVSFMVQNDKEVARYTGLAERIQKIHHFLYHTEGMNI